MEIVYWKAKDGSYPMYDVDAYYSGEEGAVRRYYYGTDGDLEAKT